MSETLRATMSAAGIILFMVLIFFGAHYATKLIGRTSGMRSNGEGLEVISRTVLGKEQALVIVRVGDKALLLGVTAQQISRLEELDPADFPAAPPQAGGADFLSTLKEAWHKQSGREDKRP